MPTSNYYRPTDRSSPSHGSKEAVFSTRYITSDTIEEKIRLLLEKKHKLADALFDESGQALTLDDLTELLE